MTSTSEHTMVLVTWTDAHTATETWTCVDDIGSEPCIVHSCGFLLPVDDGGKPNHVTIFQSETDTGTVDSVLCIPVGMVRDVVVLGVDVKRSK